MGVVVRPDSSLWKLCCPRPFKPRPIRSNKTNFAFIADPFAKGATIQVGDLPLFAQLLIGPLKLKMVGSMTSAPF